MLFYHITKFHLSLTGHLFLLQLSQPYMQFMHQNTYCANKHQLPALAHMIADRISTMSHKAHCSLYANIRRI